MDNLKKEILTLSKAEQYEIYTAIESELFGEESGTLTKEQMEFINERLSLIESGKATFTDPVQLRTELDKLIQ